MPEQGELLIKGLGIGILSACIWFFIIINVFKKSSWVCWVLVDFIICGVVGFILSGLIIARDANIHLAQPPAAIYTEAVLQKRCELKCYKSCGRKCSLRSSYLFKSDQECSPASRSDIMAEKKRVDYICAANARYEYKIKTKRWRVGGYYNDDYYVFTTSPNVFDSVMTGDSLNIPVNEGAIGIEWVDTSKIQSR